MGADLSKDLGLYNEEEIILPISSGNETPTEPRFRMLHTDPRSVTKGIDRTPILVECTPKSKKTIPRLALDLDKNSSDISHCEEAEDESDKEIIEVNDIVKKPVKKYLETDIDAVEDTKMHAEIMDKFSAESLIKLSPDSDMPLLALKHPRVITLSSDPRSPASFEVNRSPIQVECSPSMFSLCSRIDSASFDMIDCDSDDPSAIVSEVGESPQTTVPKLDYLKDWFDGLDSKINTLSTLDTSIKSIPNESPTGYADRNLMKKQLFLTPENKNTSLKPKQRTPLGNIHNKNLTVTPKNILQIKKWRGIEDERSRRGIKLDNENTPPPLPPLPQVSSAPGKMVRKRNIADWDCDSTLFI